MAEVLLRHAAEDAGLNLEVTSSGTWAVEGEPATFGAVEAMRARGIDLTAHRSRPFDPDEGRNSDLIIAMTSVHLREVDAAMPGSATKTRLMKEVAQLAPEVAAGSDGETPAARLEGLLAAPRPRWLRRHDLDDPMGLPQGAYDFCAGELEAGVGLLVDFLVRS
jgi:protein-tyrosine-phosphatase